MLDRAIPRVDNVWRGVNERIKMKPYDPFVKSYQIHTEYTCRNDKHFVLTFMEINKQIFYNQQVSGGVSGVQASKTKPTLYAPEK